MKRFLPILLLMLSISAFGQNEVPKVDLKTLDGKTFNSQDLAKDDKVIVVSLWATWCVPCLKELDAINEVYHDWQDETNFELIAISVDDSRTVKRVRPLINGKGWDYEILLDTNNNFQRAVGAATVPFTFIIKNNEIVFRHSGYSPGAELELYEKIKEFAAN